MNEISESCQVEERTPEPELLHIVSENFNIDHSSNNTKLTKLKDILSSYTYTKYQMLGIQVKQLT